MAFLGLVPSEFSSADSERRGAITKAGNRHARRLLIEAVEQQRGALRPVELAACDACQHLGHVVGRRGVAGVGVEARRGSVPLVSVG
jgi:hypothetical protein